MSKPGKKDTLFLRKNAEEGVPFQHKPALNVAKTELQVNVFPDFWYAKVTFSSVSHDLMIWMTMIRDNLFPTIC